MKAWGISARGTTSDVKIFEIPKPKLLANGVVVEVKASSLNPADLKVISGKNGGGFLHASKFPLILGYDYSGVVAEVGAQVKGVSVGDEIFGFLPYAMSNQQGAFSQFISVITGEFGKKPTKSSFMDSAALGTAAITALQVLRDKGQVKAGSRVLINGASGGVGSAAVQIAKILGAEVWGLCSAKNISYVSSLGADRALDYNETKIENLPARFDVVFDVASNSNFSKCEKVLNEKGVYITLLPTLSLLIGILKSMLGSKSCKFIAVKSVGEDLNILAQWVDGGKLKPNVDSIVDFKDIPIGLGTLAAQKVRGKIAVKF